MYHLYQPCIEQVLKKCKYIYFLKQNKTQHKKHWRSTSLPLLDVAGCQFRHELTDWGRFHPKLPLKLTNLTFNFILWADCTWGGGYFLWADYTWGGGLLSLGKLHMGWGLLNPFLFLIIFFFHKYQNSITVLLNIISYLTGITTACLWGHLSTMDMIQSINQHCKSRK